MTTTRAGSDSDRGRDPGDFSFVLGGPLFQLFRRLGLAGDALELARRRVLVLAAVAWLPLLVLSAIEGRLVNGTLAIPFIKDIEAHVRFLVVVPLLIASELVVHQRVRFVTRQFLDRDLVPAHERSRFDAILASAYRMRNSLAAELILIGLVYGIGVGIVWSRTSLDTSSWYATPSGGGRTLSVAGIWLTYVSLPIVQFLLLRWYYRIFIWARFLWRVGRLDLRLEPTHPDRIGGLGFLALTSGAFAPLALAHGAFVSGWIANRIFLHGAALLDYKVEIAGLAIWMLVVVFVPLTAFTGKLFDIWARGEDEYGSLAERASHAFAQKWVGAASPPPEPLLGSADVRSLADMANVYAVVHSMRFAPITRQALIQVLVATLAPVAPLLLTMMPLGELVRRVAGMVL